MDFDNFSDSWHFPFKTLKLLKSTISPVPFTGCLRAYRFHFTSLHFTSLHFTSLHIHLRFMSLACHFHATFMAFSWQPQKLGSKHFHTISTALSLKTRSQFSYMIFVSVCLSVVSVFFSSFDIFTDGFLG